MDLQAWLQEDGGEVHNFCDFYDREITPAFVKEIKPRCLAERQGCSCCTSLRTEMG